MTLKTLAEDRTRVNLAAGANAQVFAALYTVPIGKTAFIKEILLAACQATAVFKMEVYVLKSGDTDLTTVAADNGALGRGVAENKRVLLLSNTITSDVTAGTPAVCNVIGRNTLLSAGDAVKLWVHYGAVTPGNADVAYLISGDEF
jgi:hypothetical protein